MSESLVRIGSHEIRTITYQNQRVVTFEMIDTVHERPRGTASRTFGYNRKRFIDGTDFYHVDSAAFNEIRVTENYQPNGFYLLTESGYLMLVKAFRDDLAWEVQRALVASYFRTTLSTIETPSILPPEFQAMLQITSNLAQATQALMGQTQQHTEAIAELKADVAELKADKSLGLGQYTFHGYARTKRKSLPRAKFIEGGRLCAKRCRGLDIEPGKEPHPIWGSVNTYPEWLIAEVWRDMGLEE